jgi:substrate import-associated zinc metallohydrolase lipoprotein
MGDSIFDTEERARNDFDRWLLENFARPYNIDFKYKMEDIESDYSYNLAPVDRAEAVKMAKLIKHLWLEVYDEVAGIEFTRRNIPKVIHLIGSRALNPNGTMTLGTAEGGLKVTLYVVNELSEILESGDIALLNDFYFHTMHHEFAHILHQEIMYPAEYRRISDSDYIGGNWFLFAHQPWVALEQGFISPYSMYSADEDFVEMFSHYLTNTPRQWNDMLEMAGTSGRAIIQQKFNILETYLKDSWDTDIHRLRAAVQRRVGELKSIGLDQTFNF